MSVITRRLKLANFMTSSKVLVLPIRVFNNYQVTAAEAQL